MLWRTWWNYPFFLNSIAAKVFISRRLCTISNNGLPGWIFCSRRFSRPRHDFSSHDASILLSRLFPHLVSRCAHCLSHRAASLVALPLPLLRLVVVSLPLSLCRWLSCRASSLIASLLSRRLLSRHTSHHLWCRMPLPMPDTSPTLPTMLASRVHLYVCQRTRFIARWPFIRGHHVRLIFVIYAFAHHE